MSSQRPRGSTARSASVARCAVVATLLGASTIACSSSDPATPTDGGANADVVGNVTCTTDPRADTYVANLGKMGTAKKLSFTLVSSDPAPPSRGTNNWKIKVADAAGAPMSGPITVKPYMPDHGHGSSVEPTVKSNGDGTFDITNLYLYMPGLWQVTLATSTDAGSEPVDTVVYSFCVQG